MEILLSVLMEWLVANKDMSISKPPIVMLVDEEVIIELTGHPSKALYTPIYRIVYLSKDVDLDTQFGKSILLHELVHHYQTLSKHHMEYECFSQAEYLAHKTQKEYLIYYKQNIPEDLKDESIEQWKEC